MGKPKPADDSGSKKPWIIRNLESGKTALATSKDEVDPKTGKVIKSFKIVGKGSGGKN